MWTTPLATLRLTFFFACVVLVAINLCLSVLQGAAVLPPPPRPDAYAGPEPRTLTAPSEIRTAARTADETILLLEDQVRRLREYAALHGPDDPFSLTEAQIEEFRRRGDPIIW